MNSISKILLSNEDVQVSTFLQEKCVYQNSVDFPDLNLGKIKQFIKCIDLIKEIGNVEHSNDWDLFLEFTISLGNQEIIIFNSPYGYSEISIGKSLNVNKYLVLDLDDIDNLEMELKQPLEKAIQLFGNSKQNSLYISIDTILQISLKS